VTSGFVYWLNILKEQPPSSADVKNAWSRKSAPPIHLRGVMLN